MIDTIRLFSPFVSENVAQYIESQSFVRQGIDMKTGDLRYVITSSDLQGSFDARIQLSVKRQRFSKTPQSRVPVLVDCEPYLSLECSANKQLVGHNVYGGHSDFQFCAWYCVSLVERLLDVFLPHYSIWLVERIDFALCFIFECANEPQDYLRSLNLLSYPRRQDKVQRFGTTGIMIHGASSCLKFYYKGAEFIKHDRPRLLKMLDTAELFELTEVANRVVRVEVELKKPKLKSLFGKYNNEPYVSEINNDMLLSEYHRYVEIFLKETSHNINKVYTTSDVQTVLFNNFKAAHAGTLFGFWLQMVSLGEYAVKAKMKKPTFYRYRKALKDLGISFTIDANDSLDKKNSIADFKPTIHSENLLSVEYSHVTKLYNEFLQSQVSAYPLLEKTHH